MPGRRRDGDDDGAQRLLETGAEAVGGVAGAALGSIGGPAGIVTGGASGVAVTRTLKSIGSAVFRRGLEERQETRAGAAFYTAYSRISARIMRGDEFRNDGFFEPDDSPMGRSPAEEILEGTLKVAANEHKERKLPFLGAFWGNLPFHAGVSRSSANFLLHLAERMTWREFVLIARAGRSLDRQAGDLSAELDRRFDDTKSTDPVVAAELDELATFGLITRPEWSSLRHSREERPTAPNSYSDSGVTEAKLTSLGKLLYELLGLVDVLHDDILDTVADGGDYRRRPRALGRTHRRPQHP